MLGRKHNFSLTKLFFLGSDESTASTGRSTVMFVCQRYA